MEMGALLECGHALLSCSTTVQRCDMGRSPLIARLSGFEGSPESCTATCTYCDLVRDWGSFAVDSSTGRPSNLYQRRWGDRVRLCPCTNSTDCPVGSLEIDVGGTTIISLEIADCQIQTVACPKAGEVQLFCTTREVTELERTTDCGVSSTTLESLVHPVFCTQNCCSIFLAYFLYHFISLDRHLD